MTRTSATAASPFAFQKKLLDPRDIEPYLDGEFITLETRDNYHLLELKFNDDAGDSDLEYVNSDQMLNSLTTLREQIIQGDYRALYVVWLLSITQMEDDPETDEILEPPVPQGLNKLDIGLRTLLEFFGIDSHLVSAATGSTHSAESTPPPDPACGHGLREQEYRPNSGLLEWFSEVPPIGIERVEDRRPFRVSQSNRYELAVGAVEASQTQVLREFGEFLIFL